jgi:hypothetical protein
VGAAGQVTVAEWCDIAKRAWCPSSTRIGAGKRYTTPAEGVNLSVPTDHPPLLIRPRSTYSPARRACAGVFTARA